jgi:hypothetical protein
MKETDRVTGIFIVKTFIEKRFDEIRDYKNVLNSAIAREKNLIGESIDKLHQNISEEGLGKLYVLPGYYFNRGEVFSEMSINSFIIVLYSFIEIGMNYLCRAGQIDKDLKLGYKDMKGTGIYRAKLYLEKVIGLDLHVNKNPWREIKAISKIRNTIVHHDGFIDEELIKDSIVKSYIEKGFIEIVSTYESANDKIIIKFDYLDWIITQAEEFFSYIEV